MIPKRILQTATLLLSVAALFSASSLHAQAPVVDMSANPAVASRPVAAQSSSGELFAQLQQLQQEVMELRGIVEEQTYEINQLKQKSMDRYIDLDRRVSQLGSGAPTLPVAAGAVNSATSAAASTATTTTSAPTSSASATDAYKAAYAKVKAQQFPQAIVAFNRFLQNYPNDRYAPNAHYWLGELYLVAQPQDLNEAKQSFSHLIDTYPTHSKMPDALYKLAKVYFLLGDPEKSQILLDKVIKDYSGTASTAPKLAQQFRRDNF